MSIAFIIPILVTFLFGFAYQGELSHIPIGIADEDNTSTSVDLVLRILNSRVLSIEKTASSPQELTKLVSDGVIRGGIYIPYGFQDNINRNITTVIVLTFDGSQPQLVTIVQAELSRIIGEMQQELLAQRGGSLPIEIIQQNVFLQSPNTVDIFSFGILGIIINFLPISLVATSVAREKETGTIESLSITPLRVSEIISGKFIAYFLISLWNIFAVLFLTVYIFGAYMAGSWIDLLLFSLLFLISNLTQGLLISIVSRNQLAANQLAFMILIPSILFSGFLYPVESLHPAFKWIHDIMPLSYFFEGARKIMINRFTLFQISNEVIVLSGVVIGTIVLSLILFKKGLS